MVRPGSCTGRKSYDFIWELVLRAQMLKLAKMSRENTVGGQNLEYGRVLGQGTGRVLNPVSSLEPG